MFEGVSSLVLAIFLTSSLKVSIKGDSGGDLNTLSEFDISQAVGLHRLCWHNFTHNRQVTKALNVMMA